MTNETAIKHIEKHMIHHGISEDYGNHVYLYEALNMAIEALRDVEKLRHINHAFMRRCRAGITMTCDHCTIDDCIAREEK
jgi:hypothetical protein